MTCAAASCIDGWRTVHSAYVDRLGPVDPSPPDPATATAEQIAKHAAQLDRNRVTRENLARSIYPCQTCQPTLFHRWAGRHFLPDHNRKSCDECRAVDKGEPVMAAEPSTEPVRDPHEPRYEQDPAF